MSRRGPGTASRREIWITKNLNLVSVALMAAINNTDVASLHRRWELDAVCLGRNTLRIKADSIERPIDAPPVGTRR